MAGDDDDGDQTQEDGPALFDAGEPAQVRKRETAAQRRTREADDWWRRILADPIGRREMWGIIQTECHAFEERFACGPNGFPQTEATWFEAGRQSVGQRIFQTILARDPVNTMRMLTEHDPRFARFAPKDT